MGFIKNFVDRVVSHQEEDSAFHEMHERELRDSERTDLDALWLELDEGIRNRAVEHIIEEFGSEVMDDLVKRCFVEGEDWYIRYHHGWGTGVRNLLRRKGIRDEVLPSGNWDDYYGCAVNEAIWRYAEEPIRKEREELERMFAEAVGGAAGP